MPDVASQNADARPPFARSRRLRTDDWPERDRLALFHDLFGGDRVRVEPLPEQSLDIDATLMKLPGIGFAWGRRSPLRSSFQDGNDRLMFSLDANALATQFGREIELEPGDAVVLSGSDMGSFTTLRPGRIVTVEFPNSSVPSLLGAPCRSFAQAMPSDSPTVRLLRTYLQAFLPTGGASISGLQQLAVAHIRDLVALALGATREAEEIANGRGVRAARMHAIKADILANLDGQVSLGAVGGRHHLSPRYVRMLFESEGTSFSEFIRDERLKRAQRMLLSPRFAQRRISDIAYEVGFNDLSYFNRSFRRRFGCSPSEMRELSWPAA